MRGFLIAISLLAATSLAFGQLESNSTEVTASRSIAIEPDTATFSMAVTSGLDTGLDQVVAAVEGAGITVANLVSVNTVTLTAPNGQDLTALLWSFTLSVPLAMTGSTTTSLAALAKTILQKNNGLALRFQLQGVAASPQAQQLQQCPVADLLTDATAQAKNLADAAGRTVGPILAISEGSAPPATSAAFFGISTLATFVSLAEVPAEVSNPIMTCSLRVKFDLYGYH